MSLHTLGLTRLRVVLVFAACESWACPVVEESGERGGINLDTGNYSNDNVDVKVHISTIHGLVMISQTAEYALRAVVYLADQDGSPRTTQQIAEATQVPAGYLAKVMQSLCRAELVRSQRGLYGGFTLSGDPAEMTALEVIDTVDPVRRIERCPLGNPQHDAQLCPLHRRLDDAAALVEESFGEATVEELRTQPRTRKAVCRFPCVT